MACIESDGTLSHSAQAILRLAEEETPAEALARLLGRPLYTVRSSLRELEAAGLVSSSAGGYTVTPAGRARAEGAPAGESTS
ncbi:MAG: hypothetical protein K8J08_08460 [Thermoanaerobaculia bacterium]|nr:hypothetical protein [Thermoanaerobaculia bacterium]